MVSFSRVFDSILIVVCNERRYGKMLIPNTYVISFITGYKTSHLIKLVCILPTLVCLASVWFYHMYAGKFDIDS